MRLIFDFALFLALIAGGFYLGLIYGNSWLLWLKSKLRIAKGAR